MRPIGLEVEAIRKHFLFPGAARIVTNNAASTQPPRELLALYQSLSPNYENVHRGQSDASQLMTRLFEASYDTIARFLGASGRKNIVVCRNTTEAHNAVMYSMLTSFRDGDNVVTTMMEHNSNYVPWYALAQEILPKLGRRVECRLVRFDPETGELDLGHMASLIDARTKLVCCTGASNFFGTKMLAPFGVGVLYAKEHLLQSSPPFLYGGDMVAEGQVHPERVEYNALPWKYSAGTPNILGTIVSAEAMRILLDLALTPQHATYFRTQKPLERPDVKEAMGRVLAWNQSLTARALDRLSTIRGVTIYGPRDASRRTSLVAFNVAGKNPMELAQALNEAGVESRAGCHCASLAHRALDLEPAGSCRLSFYLYNTLDEVDCAADALAAIVAGCGKRKTLRGRLRARARKVLPGALQSRLASSALLKLAQMPKHPVTLRVPPLLQKGGESYLSPPLTRRGRPKAGGGVARVSRLRNAQ